MYSLRNFGDMISDSARFNAYVQAISRCVRPGDVVAEIGCGPSVCVTGVPGGSRTRLCDRDGRYR